MSARPSSSLASSSIWAAVSQALTIGIGGLAAIVVLLRFGKSSETDAVFAAYGVYGVALLVCVSFRSTLPARIMEDETPWLGFDRFLGAGLAVLVVVAVALIALGRPIADLVTGDLGAHATDTARWTLSILWVAVAGQLVSSLAAAVLGIRGDFAYTSAAYALGGGMAILLILALAGPEGILAVGTGLAGGSILTAALMAWRLRRLGYRTRASRVLSGAAAVRDSALLLASAAPVLVQLNYVVTLAFAARLPVGSVTIYTTAFAAASVVSGMTAGTAAMVLAAPVATAARSGTAGLLPHQRRVVRAGLLLILPTLPLALLVGDDVVSLLLGGSFSPGDADQVAVVFVLLGGVLVANLGMQLPLLAAYAGSRYLLVAVLSILGLAIHVAASAAGHELGHLAWLAAAASVSALSTTALIAWRTFAGDAWRLLSDLVRETAIVGGACVLAFAPPALAARALGGGAWDVPAAVVGLLLLAAMVVKALPGHAAVARDMTRPLTRRPARVA